MIGNRAAVVVLCLILAAYITVPRLRSEIWLLLAIFILGFGHDLLLIMLGVLQKPTGGMLPPLWLSVLWLAFATTINHSLKTIMDKKALFMALAVVGGPICYKLGVELTDISFGFDPWYSLMVIGVVWLIVGNLILVTYSHWKVRAA